MKKLDDYFKLQKEIYDYFGYEEGWTVYPLDDRREMYWIIRDDEIWFTKNRHDLLKIIEDDSEWEGLGPESDNYYSDEVFGQKFIGADYTMLYVDTQTDGNKFLAIYDNKKEVAIYRF